MSRTRRAASRSLRAWCACVLALCFGGAACDGESDVMVEVGALAATGDVLFVVGCTPLDRGDAAMRARIEANGLSVVVKRDGAVRAADADGKKLIVVSSSVAPRVMGASFRTTAVPLLTWDPALIEEYGMVARGKSPRVDGAKITVLRYESGQQMPGLVAPARRVALFLRDMAAVLGTASGRAAVDAEIVWAAGPALPKLNGQPCLAASECGSGFCEQGVCCASACTGACTSCNGPATIGTCAPVPAGSIDPRGICMDQGAASCGTSARCDGAGACRYYEAGTLCATATCEGAIYQSPRVCDGAGTCGPSTTMSCAPYTCNAVACMTTCTFDGECVPGFRCFTGLCVPR